MKVETARADPVELTEDAIAIGLFEGEDPPEELAEGAVAKLVSSGEAKRAFRKLAHTHSGGDRWIVAGLGKREDWDAERARVAAALVHGRARDLAVRELCWVVPEGVDAAATAAGLAEGTVLAGYRFDRYKSKDADGEGELERLVISSPEDVDEAVTAAVVAAEAANDAREWQNTPANDLTPARLGSLAAALGEEREGLEVSVDGQSALHSHGMGAFAAVARGSEEEARLITMRYEGPEARGPVLGLVGKAVTFDTGGISIKPAAKMHEMKFDMSGGAAVVAAMGAIARLALPIRVVAVVGATENMPSGRAIKPGDIVTAMDGTTIEVNNTDAEGRLVLADCLCWAREQGAERLVDLATLTGAIVVTFGSTHAGLFGTDDEWCAAVEEASAASGELLWRLPLHPDYAELIKGRYGDITNAPEPRKAMSIVAAEFLRRFAGDVPWAHLDIAGTAWDLGRPYARTGGSGFGVRLLVELARRQAAQTAST